MNLLPSSSTVLWSCVFYSQFLLDARRLKLFGQLSTIYPIEKFIKDSNDRSLGSSLLRNSSNASTSTSEEEEDRYTIRGVELPLIIDNR